MDSKILEDSFYLQIIENLRMAYNDDDENRIQYFSFNLIKFLLLHSDFFDYIYTIKLFLIEVEDNFYKRFGNLDLSNDEDKTLFEDYINFLATYQFDKCYCVSFWKETFVPLNLEEKEKLIKIHSGGIKFELIEKGEKLKILDIFKDSYIIDAGKYNITNLVYDLKYETQVENIKWKLNKYMKPNFYKSNLFVCNTKEYWKQLLIDIFRSQAYKQIRDSLFTQSQVDFFLVDDIIKDIIDNIKFYIYNTKFLGGTNRYNNTLYDYGDINLEIENKSVAILIFYGFHIIINIQEIGGNLNIKYQYYISLDEVFHSPDIKEDLRKFYTSYGKARNKESGETIEIGLFGQVKKTLTIREALFILNKKNYSLTANNFKINFQKCNNQKLSELLDEDMKVFLKKLEIDISNLDEDDNNAYTFSLKRKFNSNEAYYVPKLRHPLSFYLYETNSLQKFFQNYPMNDEDLKKNNYSKYLSFDI